MVGEQQDQGRNQKVPWNKWIWRHNNPKSVGDWESNLKREIHSIIGLSNKMRKRSNKPFNFTLKELEKEQQSPMWVEGRK